MHILKRKRILIVILADNDLESESPRCMSPSSARFFFIVCHTFVPPLIVMEPPPPPPAAVADAADADPPPDDAPPPPEEDTVLVELDDIEIVPELPEPAWAAALAAAAIAWA